jgi:hypothetical protein
MLKDQSMANEPIEAREQLFARPASAIHTTTLNIGRVAADAIDVNFATMPGNQPNDYGNFLAIWQSPDSIPWDTEPLVTFPVPTDAPSGSATLTGLDINNNSYIVGYAVGPTQPDPYGQKYANICATAFIPATSSGNGTIFTPGISGIQVGTTSVSFMFTLPDGIKPKSNQAYAVLYRGDNPSFYNKGDGIASVLLSPDFSFGTTAFNNVNIGRGLTYTIGIFMSGYSSGPPPQMALACSASFTN